MPGENNPAYPAEFRQQMVERRDPGKNSSTAIQGVGRSP